MEGGLQGSPGLRKKQVILKTEGKLHQSRGSLKRTGLPPPSYPSAVSPEPTSVSPNKSRSEPTGTCLGGLPVRSQVPESQVSDSVLGSTLPQSLAEPNPTVQDFEGSFTIFLLPREQDPLEHVRPQHHFTELSYAFGNKSLPSQRSVQKCALHLQPSLYHLPTCLCSPGAD